MQGGGKKAKTPRGRRGKGKKEKLGESLKEKQEGVREEDRSWRPGSGDCKGEKSERGERKGNKVQGGERGQWSVARSGRGGAHSGSRSQWGQRDPTSQGRLRKARSPSRPADSRNRPRTEHKRQRPTPLAQSYRTDGLSRRVPQTAPPPRAPQLWPALNPLFSFFTFSLFGVGGWGREVLLFANDWSFLFLFVVVY